MVKARHILSSDGSYCVRCGRATGELECEAVPSECVDQLRSEILASMALVLLCRLVDQHKNLPR